MRTTMTAAILIVAASAIAAAGNGVTPTSTQTAPATLDPCALMTRQDAATAVGEAVGEPKKKDAGRSAGPGMSVVHCEYTSAARHSINLTVWGFSGESAAMSVQIYKSECLKKEQVPGLGDLACWYNKDHRELQVLKGTTILTFEINRSGNAMEALTTLAKNALGRLK